MNKLRSLVMLPLIALVALSISACGGDDSTEDLDPAEVLEAAFSGDHDVTSGVLDVSASAEVPGAEGGSGSLSITAPFNAGDTDEVPEAELTIDLEGEAAGESIDLAAGGALTPDGATVNFQGADYAVPDDLFSELADGLIEGMAQVEDGEGSLSLDDFGIDPLSWFTNLTNEGSEDIDGTETVHISADADIAAIGEDIFDAAKELRIPGAELPEGFDPSALAFLEGFFEEASIDVFAEEDGHLLRRLDVTLRLRNLSAAAGGDGPDSASFEFSLTLNKPNEEQEIELPTDTQPIDELEQALRDEFGDAFDIAEELGLPGRVRPGDLGLGDGAGGKSGKADRPGVTEDYLECLKDASRDSPEAIAKCAEEFE